MVYLCTEQAAGISGRIFMVCGNDLSVCSINTDDRVIFKQGEEWTIEELQEYLPSVLLA